jgi:hypothetical protein
VEVGKIGREEARKGVEKKVKEEGGDNGRVKGVRKRIEMIIVDNVQCISGLYSTPIYYKCDIYDDTCKIKCMYASSNSTCSERSSDCFWLLGTYSSNDQCKEKV